MTMIWVKLHHGWILAGKNLESERYTLEVERKFSIYIQKHNGLLEQYKKKKRHKQIAQLVKELKKNTPYRSRKY
jgi:hypothetical protein